MGAIDIVRSLMLKQNFINNPKEIGSQPLNFLISTSSKNLDKCIVILGAH